MGGETSGFPPQAAGRGAAPSARGHEPGPAQPQPVTQGWRRIDDPLLHRERLAALGELVAEVVHEIRNPLVVFKTFLQLLPERGSDPELERDFAQLVGEELERVERLIAGLLAHARPTGARAATGGTTEVATPLASISRLIGQRALSRDVELRCDSAEGLPRLAIGEDALRQVLLNLLLNALDATPEGGRVDVCARAHQQGVVIEVDDGGPGIPAELRERVFEPFYSTRAERPGGLGLAVSRRLVDEAGGRIEIGAAASGGARFRVWLPRAPEPG